MSWLKARDWATGAEYSKLFHSGLRAISLRLRARHTGADSSSLSSWENILRGGTSVEGSLSSSLKRSTKTNHPGPYQFMLSEPTSALPSRTSNVAHLRPSSMLARSLKETADAWSSRGIFIEIGDYPEFFGEERRHAGYLMLPIEMEAAHAMEGSRSLVVDLGDTDIIAVPQVTEDESFLSLQDTFPSHPVPLGDQHPLSLPLPRRTLEEKWERGDGTWVLEESSPELAVHELRDEDGRNVADWRQFHVDWVRNIR